MICHLDDNVIVPLMCYIYHIHCSMLQLFLKRHLASHKYFVITFYHTLDLKIETGVLVIQVTMLILESVLISMF